MMATAKDGCPTLYASKHGLKAARPKSTKVNKVRGTNAFQKFGIVPKRKETRRRFEEYYMRSFNNTHIGAPAFGAKKKVDLTVANMVYRN